MVQTTRMAVCAHCGKQIYTRDRYDDTGWRHRMNNGVFCEERFFYGTTAEPEYQQVRVV